MKLDVEALEEYLNLMSLAMDNSIELTSVLIVGRGGLGGHLTQKNKKK